RATVDASAGYTNSNTAQRFFSGDEQMGRGVGNTNARASIELVWTAFDGYRMFAAKERLELQAQRSQAFTASAMQDLATQIQNVYFTAIRIRQQIDIQEQAIELNVALRDLAANKVKIGTGTSLEVLQTTTRVNADSSLLLNLFDQLRQTKISLNLLMGQAANIEFTVPPEMPETLLPQLTELTKIAIAQNYNIRLLQYDEQIALAQIKEERAALYPNLNLTAGYNYNFSRAEVGFLLSNRTFGPAVGINATYNLFPGRDVRKDIDNARLLKENVALNRTDAERTLRADLALLYQEYSALQNQLDLEQRTLQTGSTNTQLAQQLYRSGRATNFDVREAILAETQIKDRISDVRYRQKLIEVELKSVAGIPLFR
ncbi:MAG: TolC family protein, partial [Bacteroidota bacterium]